MERWRDGQEMVLLIEGTRSTAANEGKGQEAGAEDVCAQQHRRTQVTVISHINLICQVH